MLYWALMFLLVALIAGVLVLREWRLPPLVSQKYYLLSS